MNKLVKRAVDGVLCIEKPYRWSSNQALQQVKRWFHAEKAGHTGALDPLATGLLPICFGEATKFGTYWLAAEKRYRVDIKLGFTSTTGDLEGVIAPVLEWNGALSKADIEGALMAFLGEQEQQVSPYSALKYRGKPSYQYARQSIEIPAKRRMIVIQECRCLYYDYPRLHVEIACSKGTYIRSLVADLGHRLGCGAYVESLSRTGIADWSKASITWKALERLGKEALVSHEYTQLDRLLAPTSCLLSRLPALCLTDQAVVHKLFQGQTVLLSDRARLPSLAPFLATTCDSSQPIALFADSMKTQLIGIGCIVAHSESGSFRLKPKRLVCQQRVRIV